MLDCQIAPLCQIVARLPDCQIASDCWIAGVSGCFKLLDGQIVRLHQIARLLECQIARLLECWIVRLHHIARLLASTRLLDWWIVRLRQIARLPDCWIVRLHQITGWPDCQIAPDCWIAVLLDCGLPHIAGLSDCITLHRTNTNVILTFRINKTLFGVSRWGTGLYRNRGQLRGHQTENLSF